MSVCDSGGLHDEHDRYANAGLDLFISIYKRNHNIQVFFSLIAGRARVSKQILARIKCNAFQILCTIQITCQPHNAPKKMT